MSAETARGGVSVSQHAVQRYIQRTGCEDVFAAEIASLFERGIRVEVDGKRYTEARWIQAEDEALILLRCDSHVTTVLYARAEEVTFVGERPDLQCRDCGVTPREASNTARCAFCDSREWVVVE